MNILGDKQKSFHCIYFKHRSRWIWFLNVSRESKAQYARYGVLTTLLPLDSGLLGRDGVLLGEWFPAFFLGTLDRRG